MTLKILCSRKSTSPSRWESGTYMRVCFILLIALTERTVEIGVRKAMGAKKKDILLQFLAESVTVSLLGSLLGLMLGILATLAIVPIIKALADVPFQAAYTIDAFLIISVIAIIVGIVFGTYPATRAAKLYPVEAIRSELSM